MNKQIVSLVDQINQLNSSDDRYVRGRNSGKTAKLIRILVESAHTFEDCLYVASNLTMKHGNKYKIVQRAVYLASSISDVKRIYPHVPPVHTAEKVHLMKRAIDLAETKEELIGVIKAFGLA